MARAGRLLSWILGLVLLFWSGTAQAAVMVPLRPVLEGAGIRVGWDGEAATGRWGDRVLKVAPGSGTAYLDGRPVSLDAVPVVLGGVTFVPNTLFDAFLEPLAPLPTPPVTTRVRVRGDTWLIGRGGSTNYYRLPLAYLAPADEALTGAGRVWLVPAGNGAIVAGLLRRMEGELQAVSGAGYTLAPRAAEVFAQALEENARTVALPVQRRIGACVVNFSPGRNEQNNMLNAVKAAAYLNGTVVPPGGTFSYNAAVDRRTAERGFVIGYAISGDRYVPARGGGVCRTSTVLYGAVLDAKLPVTERHPHSLPVGYVPPGRDASVSWGAADLKFRNNRSHPVWIEAGGTVKQLYVYLWEVEV